MHNRGNCMHVNLMNLANWYAFSIGMTIVDSSLLMLLPHLYFATSAAWYMQRLAQTKLQKTWRLVAAYFPGGR